MSIPSLIQETARELQTVSRNNGSMPDVLTEPEREVVGRLEHSGYSVLGTGTARVVVELDDSTVVKLARPGQDNYHGTVSNKREHTQFVSASDALRQRLAPIHDIGPNQEWLTMERATEIRGYEHEITDEFRQECKEMGVDLNGDTLLWNVGYVPSRGHDCFIDYGHSLSS